MKYVLVAIAIGTTLALGCGGGSPGLTDGGIDGSAGDADTDVDADADSDTDSDGDTDTNCGESNFDIEGVKVDMLILLDRSNSMCNEDLWEPMGDSLTTVTAGMDVQINFGLALFPTLACVDTTNQCGGASSAYVPIHAPNATADIADAVDPVSGVGCCGGTPTADSLGGALSYLDTVDDDLQRFVLLATDGAPNCNYDLDGSDCTCVSDTYPCDGGDGYQLNCLDDVDTIAAATALEAAGYSVYVIGVGDSLDWQAVMNDIAEAGGTDAYYPAEDPDELLAAMQTIVGEIITCEFDIDWDTLPPEASQDPEMVNFYGDGDVILFDEDCADGSGWDWVDEDTIVFCDGACEDLQGGTWDSVTATFGCDSQIE